MRQSISVQWSDERPPVRTVARSAVSRILNTTRYHWKFNGWVCRCPHAALRFPIRKALAFRLICGKLRDAAKTPRARRKSDGARLRRHMSDRRSPAPLSSSLPPMARCGDGPLRATAEVRPCQG